MLSAQTQPRQGENRGGNEAISMFPRGTERMAMRQSVLNGLNIKFHIIRLILDEFLLVTISDITLTFQPFHFRLADGRPPETASKKETTL